MVFYSFSVPHMGLVEEDILVEEWGDQAPQEVQHMAMVKEGVSIMHQKVNYFFCYFHMVISSLHHMLVL
jgi:hypothetical protein